MSLLYCLYIKCAGNSDICPPRSCSHHSSICSSCCHLKHTLIPILISVIAIFLALGAVAGISIRWAQMDDEIQHLRVVVVSLDSKLKLQSTEFEKFRTILESLEIKQTARSALSLAQKADPSSLPPTPITLTKSAEPGTTYIRWGGTDCGRSDSTLVYSGRF